MKNFIKITTLTIITAIISSSVLAQPAPNEQKPNLRPQPPIQAGNPNSQQPQPPKQPNNPQARSGESARPQQPQKPQPPVQAGNPNSQQAQPPKQPNNPQARPGTGENTRPQQQR